jgi:NADH-quinone oxidoreductase subunit J
MNTAETGFLVLSAAAVLGALILVIGARSTVGAVLGAVGSSVAIAGLFALLAAPFLFVTQLLLVTGASLVGLLFVVLLVDLEAGRLPERTTRRRLVSGFGVIATASLMGVLALSLESTRRVDLPVDSDLGGAFAMGRALYGDFAPALVALSLVMLTALVAARVLSPAASSAAPTPAPPSIAEAE